jgi:hypothetical protein
MAAGQDRGTGSATGRASPGSLLLFLLRRSEPKRGAVSQLISPAWTARDETRQNVPLDGGRRALPLRVCATLFSGRHSPLFWLRVTPAVAFFPTQRVCAGDAASLRRAAPWRVRSQSPASSIELRVFLLECGASLPERIHPPGSTVIFLRGHPRAPVRSSLVPALSYPLDGRRFRGARHMLNGLRTADQRHFGLLTNYELGD